MQDNKMKNVSVYKLGAWDDERFVVLSTSNKIVDSKKMADIIAEKYGYDEKI